jgi:nicotinamidase-related amidase
MKPALLVVDVQKAFFDDPTTAQSLNEAIETINDAIALFREKQFPIICVQHLDQNGNLVPGEEGFDVPETLGILPSDVHIHKTYGNAFIKTSLKTTLEEFEIDTVFITGFCAEYCVLSAYRGAQDLDLTSLLIQGAIASATPEHIGFVERISDVISYGTLKKVIG